MLDSSHLRIIHPRQFLSIIPESRFSPLLFFILLLPISLRTDLSRISIRITNSFSARFDRHRKPIFLASSRFWTGNTPSCDQFFLSLVSMLHLDSALSSEMVIDRKSVEMHSYFLRQNMSFQRILASVYLIKM